MLFLLFPMFFFGFTFMSFFAQEGIETDPMLSYGFFAIISFCLAVGAFCVLYLASPERAVKLAKNADPKKFKKYPFIVGTPSASVEEQREAYCAMEVAMNTFTALAMFQMVGVCALALFVFGHSAWVAQLLIGLSFGLSFYCFKKLKAHESSLPRRLN